MIDYYKYIKSKAWFKRTENVRKRNHGRCECCQMRLGTVVHHRTYAHLGEEKEEELVHLCTECHEMVHGTRKWFIWPSRLLFLSKLQQEMKNAGLFGAKV